MGKGSDFIPLLDAVPSPERLEGSAIKGIGIVAACRDRQELLKAVVPSWLAISGIAEIVLVDWSSSPPLAESIEAWADDKRLKTIRVTGEPKWVLTRAYNLAVAVAKSEWIIRLDCDYRIETEFLNAHFGNTANTSIYYNPATRRFWSGHWQNARNDNEIHLNGALLVRRGDFLEVGGYDERIQTYGWDDENLFNRLEGVGLMRYKLDYNQLAHTSHGDAIRKQNGMSLPEVNIEYNSLLLERLPQWHGVATRVVELAGMAPGRQNALQVSRYERMSNGKGSRVYLKLKAVSHPPSAADLVLPHEKSFALNLALGRRLHDSYGLCWDLMTRMGPAQRETLLRNLMKLRPETKQADELPRIIVVHVMHGLGNRLRALGSALAFARKTGRATVVVWEADRHCEARFEDLFETRLTNGEQLVAVDGIGVSWPLRPASKYDAMWLRWANYNYMQMEGGGAEKDEVIEGNTTRNIYFKAAYVMQVRPGGLTGWDSANRELRLLRAVEPVRALVGEVRQKLEQSIGVHVRHLDTGRDIARVNARTEYGADDQMLIDYWREASGPAAFVGGVKEALSEFASKRETVSMVFVAADSVEWAEALAELLPGATWGLGREADERLGCAGTGGGDGRSVGCLRRAVADVLCLAGTRMVLGSMWSSFSEAAGRLGGGELRLAGVDFGAGEDLANVARRYGPKVADVVAGVRRRRMRKRRE